MPTIDELNNGSSKSKSSKGCRPPSARQAETPEVDAAGQEDLEFSPDDMQGALLAPVLGAGRDLVTGADRCYSQVERAVGAAIAKRQQNFVSNAIGYSIEYSQAARNDLDDTLDGVIGEVNAATFLCPTFTSAPHTRPRMAGSGGNRTLLAAEPTNQPTSTQPTNQPAPN